MSFELFSKIYFTLIYSILSWIGIGGAILMIFYGQSIQALFLGYSILIIIFSIYMLIWFKKRKPIMGVLCLHLGIIFTLFLLYGKQEINKNYKNYSSVSLGKEYSYNLLNIFSEKELLDMGFAASIVLQISEEQKNQFQDIFYEVENSQDISLPSAIPNALVNKKEARYVLYNPQNTDTDNLIFLLHGNAGGFLFYPKIFQSIADKYNAKMVMPQFGWGNWNELGGKELIYDTYNDLLQKNIISTKTKITIIAVSNGGVGVAEILKSDTENIFSTIICISCVFDTKQYEKTLSRISEKRFLILHGDQDERTPLENYLHIQNALPKHSNKIYQDQNHFLLLQKKDDILKEIENFMQ